MEDGLERKLWLNSRSPLMSCQGLQIEKNDISKFLFILLSFFVCFLSFCFSDRLGSLENEFAFHAKEETKDFQVPLCGPTRTKYLFSIHIILLDPSSWELIALGQILKTLQTQ